jgi:hypothetical protein
MEALKFINHIAENFHGVQFSRFSRISGYPRKLDPRNKYDCTVYNGHDRTRPQKLNRKNFEDWPSLIIGPHENFTLYGISELIYSTKTQQTDPSSYLHYDHCWIYFKNFPGGGGGGSNAGS